MKHDLTGLCNTTKLSILNLLVEKPSGVTQLHERLFHINNRESVFKSLDKMLRSGLVNRELKGNKYVYSLGFRELSYGKLKLVVK